MVSWVFGENDIYLILQIEIYLKRQKKQFMSSELKNIERWSLLHNMILGFYRWLLW